MHVVILGCGRVGALLADRLDGAGHSVAVVDQDPQAFRRLSGRFTGDTVKGIGFDRETLEKAGIEKAHAFAAVSSGDNTNILAARVARETYGVEHVVARIYDPRRAEVYQRLGIPTVATVSWTAEQIVRRLMPQDAQEEYRDASGQAVMSEVPVHASWYGHAVQDMEYATGARVAFVNRLGSVVIPVQDSVLQDGDLVHVVALGDRTQSVADTLAAPREQGLAAAGEGSR